MPDPLPLNVLKSPVSVQSPSTATVLHYGAAHRAKHNRFILPGCGS
jgi:hypothetical protein